MAILTSSCLISPNFTPISSQSVSSSVRLGRSRISAAYSTVERTSPATISSLSLYDVLGIQMGADLREVKTAYRRLARVLHPDVGNEDSSADEFMKVHSAYTTLADPVRRADYDRSLLRTRVACSSPIRSSGGYRGRKWETDQCW